MLISENTELEAPSDDIIESIQENGVNESLHGSRKARPTPESIAMDRGIQNIARKAHKNSKGDDKKLGMLYYYLIF